MLYCDRIDVSEGIDVNKINESKYLICDICHCWYILDIYLYLFNRKRIFEFFALQN